ncbi:condensation domain-containing protein, partial [Immundisolibacter sp.]|uniref:condensation domain-containing protein n=1 Tax=Immundisolibacter sp. TaxID=1934948 RepID=UPI003561FCC1
EDVPGSRQLVGYVSGADLSAPGLRDALTGSLPEYMVPSQVVVLERLPLTANGKLDRKALPAPGGVQTAPHEVPKTPTEHQLARLWSELLGCQAVGRSDHFFMLGGNSLSAARLAAQVREVFGVELPLRRVFQAADLGELARSIDALSCDSAQEHPPTLHAADHSDRTQLSFAQRRMWILDEMESGAADFNAARAYNMSGGVRIAGPLEVVKLGHAAQVVIGRQESLRTTFELHQGEIWQRVLPEQPLSLDVLDLAELTEAQKEARLRELAVEEANRSFDLARGRRQVERRTRLFRMRLVRLAPDSHVLFLAMHHIISDGWSLRILVDELLTVYNALVDGHEPALPQLTVQYRDYAVWQREWLKGESLDRQLAYWREQLDDVAPLELWTDRPRPARQSFAGRHVRFSLTPDLSARLRQLCRERGVTPFVALLGAFKALLYRHTGQEDICIGTPVANRSRVAVEPLIGFFVNTLALRSQVYGAATFLDLLGQLQQTVLDAFTHQDLPFEYLVDHLDLARDPSRNALFQVMFALQDDPLEAISAAGSLHVTPYEFETGVAKFDLALTITEREDGFAGEFEYNTKLFDGARIERMAEHLEQLLAGICDDPVTRLEALPMLSTAEYARVVHEWNDTAVSVPRRGTVAEQFEARARELPDRLAVADTDQRLNYAALDRRANRVASLLAAKGTGPGDLVGVCLRRSVGMIVAQLAALKLGAAYVPMDPDLPAQRIEAMAGEAGLRVLIVVTDREEVATKLGAPYLTEADLGDGPDLPAAWREPRWSEADRTVAYVIHTSGSTGKPKGVCVTHEGLNNLVFWHHTAYATDAQDRATLLAGPGFDASVWEVWPYLTAGASLHIPADEVRMDPRRLVGWLVEQRITRSLMTTPLAEAVLDQAWPKECALRTLLTGGDQ